VPQSRIQQRDRTSRRQPPAAISKGRIRDVHPRYWTVDVELENGAFIESAPVVSPYFHQENGEGFSALPEIGAHCLLLTGTAEGYEPAVLAFTPLRSTEYQESEEPEEDHSAGRGPAVPGDIYIHGRDENFVRLRRGGVVEIGADEGTRSWYIPFGNLIRHICANYELSVSGSVARINTLDSPEIPEEGPTPLQLDLRLQEYVEKAPLIDLKMGHVVDDEGRSLAANQGDIVARMLVFDQTTADAAQRDGIDPSPDQAAVAIRFDKNGNAEQIMSGQWLVQAAGRRLYLTDSDVQLVRGNRREEITGNADRHIGGDVIDRADGSRVIQSRGPLTISCEQLQIEEQRARQTSMAGNRGTIVGGNSEDQVAGDRTTGSGGGVNDTCLGNRAVTTGGKVIETVLHAAEPTSMLQGAVAHLLDVLDGTIRQKARLGNIELEVGPLGSPICKITVHNNPTQPTEIGRVSITWANPAMKLIIDGLTGAATFTNMIGEWTLGADGRQYVGPRGGSGPGAGNVVTTNTHPFCYVTGAPIIGCSGSTAAGVPAPGPAAPVVGPADNIPDPDIPRP
jgi:hypothetical protein